jgi:hypothetical protein
VVGKGVRGVDWYTADEGKIAMDPEEIELNDEVVEVERRPRAGVVVSVRLSADEADELQRVAERRGTTLSRVAREAITGYLAHGPGNMPAGAAWTGTVSGSSKLELSYTHSGPIVRTGGQVREAAGS